MAVRLEKLVEDLELGNDVDRCSAARALGRADDPRAVDPLIGALKDDYSWVREYAAFSLARLGDRRAVSALIDALGDRDYRVSGAVAFALGELADASSVGSLEEAIKSEDRWIRRSAEDALAKIAGREEAAAEPLAEGAEDQGILEKNTDEIVETLASGMSIIFKKTTRGYALKVPIEGGRSQKIRLYFGSKGTTGAALVQIATVLGPAKRRHFKWALATNPSLTYGALGVMRIGNEDVFVITKTLVQENTSVGGIRDSIVNLAREGDRLENDLTGQDLY